MACTRRSSSTPAAPAALPSPWQRAGPGKSDLGGTARTRTAARTRGSAAPASPASTQRATRACTSCPSSDTRGLRAAARGAEAGCGASKVPPGPATSHCISSTAAGSLTSLTPLLACHPAAEPSRAPPGPSAAAPRSGAPVRSAAACATACRSWSDACAHGSSPTAVSRAAELRVRRKPASLLFLLLLRLAQRARTACSQVGAPACRAPAPASCSVPCTASSSRTSAPARRSHAPRQRTTAERNTPHNSAGCAPPLFVAGPHAPGAEAARSQGSTGACPDSTAEGRWRERWAGLAPCP